MTNCLRMMGILFLLSSGMAESQTLNTFEGKYFRGQGDTGYLEMLDISRRMFDPDPEFQNFPMLYIPSYNGFGEGPRWGGFWIQNSYGTTYCSLPFLHEPYLTFLQNSHDLWFSRIGDGATQYTYKSFTWTPPDGCLVDAATKDEAYHKQGDGWVDLHDWALECTAAGALLQSELLLISRDKNALARYLPLLERSANFVETRRDPRNNLFLAGAAANLLAPSFAGWYKGHNVWDKSYLAGLSISYIALLDRVIELEKLAGNTDKAALYTRRRDDARRGLPLLTTDEGYFIKSLDPDSTRHGVYGAPQYGYFEAVCNHDAICFRVVDNAQARKIYEKIASISGLRPYEFILTNYPSLTDMYKTPHADIWEFGTWVNGGCWLTCEARMMMGYYRLGKFEDIRRSMKQFLTFARRFRLDSPLLNFGSGVWFLSDPVNLTYDDFGPPAAMVRGLFEYIYRADGLELIPHIPPDISHLEQLFPIRYGEKKLYLAATGTGPISGILINGSPLKDFDPDSVFLKFEQLPDSAAVHILMGGADSSPYRATDTQASPAVYKTAADIPARLDPLLSARVKTAREKYARYKEAGLGNSYAAAHAQLIMEYHDTILQRSALFESGKLRPLQAYAQEAADESFIDTLANLCDGLDQAGDPVTAIQTRAPVPFELLGNYPNPFNASTVIHFRVPDGGPVVLSVYSLTGQKVRDLVTGEIRSGSHEISWDGTDNHRKQLSSGIFFLRLTRGAEAQTGKMLLLK